MIDDTYRAQIQFAAEPSTIDSHCSNCDWTGKADRLEPIGDAILTPGDPSPAGRCPECDCLAYVTKPALDLPFATPIRLEDGKFLVTHDCELILEASSAEPGELEAIVRAVNTAAGE